MCSARWCVFHFLRVGLIVLLLLLLECSARCWRSSTVCALRFSVFLFECNYSLVACFFFPYDGCRFVVCMCYLRGMRACVCVIVVFCYSLDLLRIFATLGMFSGFDSFRQNLHVLRFGAFSSMVSCSVLCNCMRFAVCVVARAFAI